MTHAIKQWNLAQWLYGEDPDYQALSRATNGEWSPQDLRAIGAGLRDIDNPPQERHPSREVPQVWTERIERHRRYLEQCRAIESEDRTLEAQLELFNHLRELGL